MHRVGTSALTGLDNNPPESGAREIRLLTLLRLIVVLASGAPTMPDATAHEAHVHGQATLQISLAGDTLTLALHSPLDNLLGFETAPTSQAQRQAVAAMAARLRSSESFAMPSPEAACTAGPARLHAPVLGGTAGHDGATGAQAAGTETHGNLTAEHRFTCLRPQALREIRMTVFEAMPRLKRINAQIAGPSGQSAQRLTPRNPTARL